jgi:hypothetical protein
VVISCVENSHNRAKPLAVKPPSGMKKMTNRHEEKESFVNISRGYAA